MCILSEADKIAAKRMTDFFWVWNIIIWRDQCLKARQGWVNKVVRIIGFLSKEVREFLSLLTLPPLRPLLVLNPLAFICLRITCQLNLVIDCVIRKQTLPSAPVLLYLLLFFYLFMCTCNCVKDSESFCIMWILPWLFVYNLVKAFVFQQECHPISRLFMTSFFHTAQHCQEKVKTAEITRVETMTVLFISSPPRLLYHFSRSHVSVSW